MPFQRALLPAHAKEHDTRASSQYSFTRQAGAKTQRGEGRRKGAGQNQTRLAEGVNKELYLTYRLAVEIEKVTQSLWGEKTSDLERGDSGIMISLKEKPPD